MLAGGLVFARLEHLLLNWDYFARQVPDIAQWIFPQRGEAGLEWHGAFFGALLILLIYPKRWLATNANRMTLFMPAFALTFTLIAFCAWVTCAAQGCAYGAEVDTLARYSPLIVGETRDLYGIPAPRYNTQFFGAGLSLVCFMLTLFFYWRGLLKTRMLWMILMLFSAGMFFIGFYRADFSPRWFGLRADQALDMLLFAFACARLIIKR